MQLHDSILILNGIAWDDYVTNIKAIANESKSRSSYYQEIVEIMSPGRNHETIKENIALLVVAYCDTREIDYTPTGSMTIKNEEIKVAKEPDTSFIFSEDAENPELAVEVNYSSGGVNDLERYLALKVREVWLWDKNDTLVFFVLDNGSYKETSNSYFFPELESETIQKYVKLMLAGNTRIVKRNFIGELKNVAS